MSADRCPYNLDHACEPVVRTVGDLTARHLGKRIRIPGLHQPGADWDAPHVTVEGRLNGMRAVGDFINSRAVRLELSGASMHDIITLSHPCEVLT